MSGSSAGVSLEPVRRFEVFTGEGRRRKWSVSEKMAIVAEMAGSDNISELARRHGLRSSQLFTWRRELRYASEAAAVPVFVPAVIEAETKTAAAPERVPSPIKRRRSGRANGPAAAVEIDIDGVSVKIARGADAAVIAAVIEALKMTR